MTVLGLSRRGQLAVLVIAGITLFILGFLIGFFTAPDDEKSPETPRSFQEKREEERKKKDAYHSKLYQTLDKKEIGKSLKYFSSRPHVPGTPRTKELAVEIARLWREYKFDEVEMPKYNVLLPYVNPNISNKVQILDSGRKVLREFSGKEELADPSEDDDQMIPPFLGYSKQSSASGKLLYVNYGRTEDFEVLKKNFGIPNCNGRIAIMRYGKIFRGSMVKNAHECGAVGAILYNDPADYAPEGQDKVYPNYIWLPKTGVQRGSIITTRGDPITPGLPSIDGVFRISPKDAGLPQIPATPMPYGDAVNILKIMKGREVPTSWKGTLNITYRLGDAGIEGNNSIRIEVNFPNTRQDIYNVIGTIYGSEEPDRWVLIGNHRDAWGFGAVDASSGTATMMEISRGLSMLLKQGWRPRRTIKFCSWGAEEAGLIGSNEWVEEHERALSTKAVSYINVDVSVGGTYVLHLSGSPLLKTALIETVKNVQDPHLNSPGLHQTVYERMLEKRRGKDGEIMFPSLGAGSDYATFYQFVGVPSLDMSYYGERLYPIYHSVHDTYKWLQGLVDPDFSYHLTTTLVAARALMSIADDIVLPFDVVQYSKTLRRSFQILNDNHGAELRRNNITLDYVDAAVTKFHNASLKFQKEVETAVKSMNDIQLRDLNDRMVNVEKSFIYSFGLPNQSFTRHVIFAPPSNNNYGSAHFPGIIDLMIPSNETSRDWGEIRKQVSVVFKSIMSAVESLNKDAKD
ncbi:glutamate carboxypeptidase 2-like isoform X1 [Dendronephthya gigantea]|uniref:glutamate carboxypeptidase 2-like isoform X1 n=2 Tax=Dendronephthya gigantea TaxID=151771 RepID=UPI00106BDF2C|nr:glutamate carboxypeptidase 2-like isoform X1 [Dendronephthya gigantea]XP_028415065.1 glutamate carboxypeptidase 2-like isoform X1 [Dendronephthya gigantea]